MGALRELGDMARDYGLGLKYFVLSAVVISALMALLFLWGREVPTPPTAPAPSLSLVPGALPT